MRLVRFLIHLLEAHAQTLQRLAAFYGEEELMEMLESADDLPEAMQPAAPKIDPAWFDPEKPQPGGYSPYMELEGAVRDFKLSEVLQFHLWAYPQYRAFIESDLDLNSTIREPSEAAARALVDASVAEAEAWVRRLPVPPALREQTERLAHVPWLRFRSTVLKRIGFRPMGPVPSSP